MKKFPLFLAAIVAFLTPARTLSALGDETRYSRVVTDDVVLYMDAGMNYAWFTLPYGYYVKILSVNSSSVKVEYKDGASRPSAKGYIDISALNIVSEIPPVLYPSLILTVKETCMLYKDSDFTYTETITPNSTIEYYGTYYGSGGQKYIYGYVSATTGDKYVGYIPYASVYEFTPPRLEIEVPKIDEETETPEKITEEEPDPPQTSDGLGNALQIIIIIAVSLVAVSIVYFLFRPSAVKAKDEAIGDDDL